MRVFTNRIERSGTSACVAAERDNDVLYEDERLRVLALPWAWACANKLDRYQKHDSMDITYVLWFLRQDSTEESVWEWITENCGPWVQEWKDREVIPKIRRRIGRVMARLDMWKESGKPLPDPVVDEDLGEDKTDNSEDYE